MKNFVLINLCETNIIKKYVDNSNWKRVKLSPQYSEIYVCFSINKHYSFEELFNLFLSADPTEQIGAISIISEKYPTNLYNYLLNNIELIPTRCIKFLLYRVVNSYLPLIIPEDKLLDYDFGDNYFKDVWVNLFLLIKSNLAKRGN